MKGEVVNHLIDGLPSKHRAVVLRRATAVELAAGQLLCERDEPTSHAYFPLTASISLAAPVSGRQPLQLALVGNEGMFGAPLALGIRTTPMLAVVQGTGTALRLPAHGLLRLFGEVPALLQRTHVYLYGLLAELSQTALCNRFHTVESRLARWLLMSHDRSHAEYFDLTHSALAGLLGVRRSGVTTAAGDFQRRDLISYRRGRISILDRRRLEGVACRCYAATSRVRP